MVIGKQQLWGGGGFPWKHLCYRQLLENLAIQRENKLSSVCFFLPACADNFV